MDVTYKGSVLSIKDEATGLSKFDLDVSSTPLPGTHVTPGQYVKLGVPGVGESWFAIASRPNKGGGIFEFLIKRGTPLADALLALKVGDPVDVSAPRGKGFPLDAGRGRNVLLFATGSGISAIRSVIEEIRNNRAAFKNVVLYFGARTPDAFAYGKELDAWERAGIRVIRTVSKPGDSGWKGLTGYVQAHLDQVEPEAVAFVSGQKAMVQSCTEALAQRGLPKERVFLNF
jgi:NAD(P)H-flavin reductase